VRSLRRPGGRRTAEAHYRQALALAGDLGGARWSPLPRPRRDPGRRPASADIVATACAMFRAMDMRIGPLTSMAELCTTSFPTRSAGSLAT
jgi:hypothetical protein